MNMESFRLRLRSQEGSLVVIVMMFVLVFMAIGAALFFLVQSSNRGVATERKDVKSFNVAEAGVDAGLAVLSLSANWPRTSTDHVTVSASAVRNSVSIASQPAPSSFDVTVTVYDDGSNNPRTTPANRVLWDQNGNGKMWIDSSANYDKDSHRIIVLAQRQTMPVSIPDVALAAGSAGGNGQGLYVGVDPSYTGPLPIPPTNPPNPDFPDGSVGAFYTDTIGKGLDPGADVAKLQAPDAFSSRCPAALTGLLKSMATAAGSFYSDSNGGASAAQTRLCSASLGPGSIVYLETTADPVTIAGNTPMGTPEKPIILVIDTMGTGHGIDWRGTAQFYGIVIVLGDVLLRGTMDIRGCVLSSGAVENKGGPGILYNGDFIRRVNDQYTTTAVMVPNTWEEYTVAQ